MRKVYLCLVITLTSFFANAQEIQTSKPEVVFFKGFQKIIKSTGDGETVIFSFKDDQYQQIEEYEMVMFENKEVMQHFFKKVVEVQNAPKSKKSVDVSVSMKDHVLNKKEVKIIRYGFKQFVTYVYVGDKSHCIIPKNLSKRILKKVNQ